MNATDKVIKAVQQWDGWSKRERERLAEVTAEVLDHCRNGTGNRFIREWCQRVLVPQLRPLFS